MFVATVKACQDKSEPFDRSRYANDTKIPRNTIYSWYKAFIKHPETFLDRKSERRPEFTDTTQDASESGMERADDECTSICEEGLKDVHDGYSSYFFDQMYDPSHYQERHDCESSDDTLSWPLFDLAPIDMSHA